MIYGSERLNRCSRVLQRPKLSNPYIRSVHLNQTKMKNVDFKTTSITSPLLTRCWWVPAGESTAHLSLPERGGHGTRPGRRRSEPAGRDGRWRWRSGCLRADLWVRGSSEGWAVVLMTEWIIEICGHREQWVIIVSFILLIIWACQEIKLDKCSMWSTSSGWGW